MGADAKIIRIDARIVKLREQIISIQNEIKQLETQRAERLQQMERDSKANPKPK